MASVLPGIRDHCMDAEGRFLMDWWFFRDTQLDLGDGELISEAVSSSLSLWNSLIHCEGHLPFITDYSGNRNCFHLKKKKVLQKTQLCISAQSDTVAWEHHHLQRGTVTQSHQKTRERHHKGLELASLHLFYAGFYFFFF